MSNKEQDAQSLESSLSKEKQKLQAETSKMNNALKNNQLTPTMIEEMQKTVDSISTRIDSIESEIKTLNNPQSKSPKTIEAKPVSVTDQIEQSKKQPLLLDAPKESKKRIEAQAKLDEAAKEQSSASKIELTHTPDAKEVNLDTMRANKKTLPTNEELKGKIRRNRGKAVGIGIGVGIASSIFDKEDDDFFTATGKTVKAGAVALGASYLAEIGLDYASEKNVQVAKMWEQTTVQDLVKGEVVGEHQRIKTKVDHERKLKTIGGKLGTVAKVGAGVIGVATIMDVGQRMADNREAKRMKHEQEKVLIEKERKRKRKNEEQSYGYVDAGEIAFELFGNRTGHYKMGNAKFM